MLKECGPVIKFTTPEILCLVKFFNPQTAPCKGGLKGDVMEKYETEYQRGREDGSKKYPDEHYNPPKLTGGADIEMDYYNKGFEETSGL